MKRIIPFFAAAIACSLSAAAFAEGTRTIQRVERINGDRAVIVTETIRTPRTVIVAPEVRLGVGTAVAQGQRTAEGADTTGVARSTGAGIGESSTRADIGTGRGGAGIVRSGTLAPRAVTQDNTDITTVPSELVPSVNGGVVVRPTIPRATTNTGTLGAGSSTPVGVAPGY